MTDRSDVDRLRPTASPGFSPDRKLPARRYLPAENHVESHLHERSILTPCRLIISPPFDRDVIILTPFRTLRQILVGKR